MTEPELAEIEARAAAATPGPWEIQSGTYLEEWVVPAGAVMLTGQYPIAEMGGSDYRSNSPNAVFLAHARTDIPALVAEVRRLQAERDQTHAWIAWAMKEIDNQVEDANCVLAFAERAKSERDQARKWAAAWKASAKHDRGLLRAAMRFIAIVSSVDAPRRDSEGVWHDPPHKRT